MIWILDRIVIYNFQCFDRKLLVVWKSLLQIILLVFILSCESKKNALDLADKRFEVCIESNYFGRIEIGPAEGNLIDKKNIHRLLEQALVKEGYLSDISKKGYLKLFEKIKHKDIDSRFFDEFKLEIGFDPLLLFPLIGQAQLKCYDQIVLREKIVDQKSWQHKVMESLWEIEKSGNLNFEDNNLVNVIKSIPDKKFGLMMYRKLFLDVIYFHHNSNK